MRDLGKWRTLFLLASALAIGGLWSQGRLETFLHPRYAALLPWTALVLLAMGLVELGRWGRGAPDGGVKFRHVVWFLPFAVGSALRPDGFSGEFAASRGLTAAGRMLAEAGVAPSDSSLLVRPGPLSPPPGPLLEPIGTPKEPVNASIWCAYPAPKGSSCVDTVRERYWYEQMLAFYMEPSRHRGRRVRLVGRVQRDDAVESGGWHVGRMMIWCCAADASPLGLYLVGAGGALPSEGGWVVVEGVLDVRRAKLPGTSRVRDVPVLREAIATHAASPPQESVFPFSH